jgi:phosphoglycolate phosphatase-like HAD superfamily hydrolase
MRIITDFDGPIMDLSDRYYYVYQMCLERVELSGQTLAPLSQAEFWQRKRACISEREIGIESGLTPTQAEKFKQLRDLHAHQVRYLHLDRVVPGAIAALECVRAARIDLLVMTLRHTRQLNPALESHDLGQFFAPYHRYCRADDYIKQGDIRDKTKMMARSISELGADADTWMIGDTEADLIAAQTHNIPVIAVLSGIRDREHLEKYQPDLIVPDLATAVATIFDRAAHIKNLGVL